MKRAWVLKDSFKAWYTETDRRKEILDFFDYQITNSFAEGRNNRIKTIKKMAYSYHNMDNFRIRILATNSGCEVRI